MLGSSIAGVPLIIIGRTKEISWGITAAYTDVSDLFREKIRGNVYKVDGEYRDLKVEEHNITVKGKDEPVKY